MPSAINSRLPLDGDKSNPAPEIRANFAAAKAEIEALQLAAASFAPSTLATGVGFTLPTSDPAVAGALWSDSGTVKVSAG